MSFEYWINKPQLGSRIDKGHPLAPTYAWLFNEGSGALVNDYGIGAHPRNDSNAGIGTKNSGTLTGLEWAGGVDGFAVNFNGSSDYVLMDSSTTISDSGTMPAFTITARMRPDFITTDNNKTFFNWYDSGGGGDPQRIFCRYKSTTGWSTDSQAVFGGQTDAAFIWTLGDWFDLTYSIGGSDASTSLYYKDGIEIATSNNSGTFNAPSGFNTFRERQDQGLHRSK